MSYLGFLWSSIVIIPPVHFLQEMMASGLQRIKSNINLFIF